VALANSAVILTTNPAMIFVAEFARDFETENSYGIRSSANSSPEKRTKTRLPGRIVIALVGNLLFINIVGVIGTAVPIKRLFRCALALLFGQY
jgi:hypothetical protein